MTENERNTTKKLFVEDYVARGKSYIEANEDYEGLTNGGKIAPNYWARIVRDFNLAGGDRNEDSIIKNIALKSEQEPEDQKEEEEEWECGKCGFEGKGPAPAYCPGCGVEFNRE